MYVVIPISLPFFLLLLLAHNEFFLPPSANPPILIQCQFPHAEKSIDQFSQDCRNVDKYLFQGVTGAQCCPKGDGACVANNTGIDDTTSMPMKEDMFV